MALRDNSNEGPGSCCVNRWDVELLQRPLPECPANLVLGHEELMKSRHESSYDHLLEAAEESMLGQLSVTVTSGVELLNQPVMCRLGCEPLHRPSGSSSAFIIRSSGLQLATRPTWFLLLYKNFLSEAAQCRAGEASAAEMSAASSRP
ncbi:hypothetical protein MHYP_G00223490 [Metynnis hypsauchen]